MIFNQNLELCSEPQSERGYEVVFHVYHTNQTLGKWGLRKCTKTPPFNIKLFELQAKTPGNLIGTTERKGL